MSKFTRKFDGGDEERLRLDIYTLQQDFDIWEEVPGVNIPEQQNVRIDYIARPRQHLIDMGFDNVCFGIEVKSLSDSYDSFSFPKFKKLLWQCITYRQSMFTIGDSQYRPAFVLYYVGNAERSENNWLAHRELITFAQLANIGRLDFTERDTFKITFGMAGYFSRGYGKGKTNAGLKLYVGTSGMDRGNVTGGAS